MKSMTVMAGTCRLHGLP